MFTHSVPRSRRLATTVGVAAGVVAICLVIVLSSGSAAGARQARFNPHAVTAVATPLTLQQHYAVLGATGATNLTPLPSAGIAARRIAHLQSMFGLDLSAARMAQGPDGTQLWMIPGTSGVCVVENTTAGYAGATCGPDIPTSGFIGKWRSDPSGQTLVGFVADGNSSITLTRADGTTTTEPVVDNAVFAQAANGDGLKSLRVKDTSGAIESIPVNIPGAP